jgi:hypothetical protein
LFNNCSETKTNSLLNIIPAQKKNLVEGVKYLGFFLKPNCYRKEDWGWLIRKVEVRISIWVNRTLSRGGRLVLLKAVLEGIPIYWNSIAAIPKGVLEKVHKLSCQYLWVGYNFPGGIHLSNWGSIVSPKDYGGWGLMGLLTIWSILSVHGWSLHDSRLDRTFPDDMQELSIFSSLSSMPQIQILSTYY